MESRIREVGRLSWNCLSAVALAMVLHGNGQPSANVARVFNPKTSARLYSPEMTKLTSGSIPERPRVFDRSDRPEPAVLGAFDVAPFGIDNR